MNIRRGIQLVILLACSITGLSGCWLVAVGAGAEAGYLVAQEDRTASETLTDQRITSTVKSKLIADPDISGMDINVDTHKGIVTLKGFVKSATAVDRAVYLAETVEGVRRVDRKLMID